MKKKRRGSLILRVAVLLIMAFAVVQLIQQSREINEATLALEAYERDIDREKREIAIYNEALSREDEDEFIEGVARDELGYIASGEQIFIPIS